MEAIISQIFYFGWSKIRGALYIFGYSHIPQRYVERLNQFNQNALNPYINYHRPCLFPETVIDLKGKQKKRYTYKNMMTPYEKFRSLPQAEQYLKTGLTFKELDDLSLSMTDNENSSVNYSLNIYMRVARKVLRRLLL